MVGRYQVEIKAILRNPLLSRLTLLAMACNQNLHKTGRLVEGPWCCDAQRDISTVLWHNLKGRDTLLSCRITLALKTDRAHSLIQ